MRCLRVSAILVLGLSAGAQGCSRTTQTGQEGAGAAQTVTYDETTGKLAGIASDLNKNGKLDTWTYMDGARPLRSEQDQDEDGKIDRWEYNAADGTILKVAVSQLKNGRADTWIYPDSQGQPARVESSAAGDETKINRREFYQAGRLIRVDEDTDGDGKTDKWETHDGPAILSAEFDLDKDGLADQRLTFDRAGALVSTETAADGRGGYGKKVAGGGSGGRKGLD